MEPFKCHEDYQGNGNFILNPCGQRLSSDLLANLDMPTPLRWQGMCLDPDKSFTAISSVGYPS